jgi:tRNA isopentenyl-2-thiomethyl-A-37 hydroxylase MiaE
MLGLKLPTDPRWVNLAEKSIEDILTDHAYCEQKATSTGISLIQNYPEYESDGRCGAPYRDGGVGTLQNGTRPSSKSAASNSAPSVKTSMSMN